MPVEMGSQLELERDDEEVEPTKACKGLAGLVRSLRVLEHRNFRWPRLFDANHGSKGSVQPAQPIAPSPLPGVVVLRGRVQADHVG